MSIYLKNNNLNSQQKAIVYRKEESEKQRRREYEKSKSEKTKGDLIMRKYEEIESVIKENEVEILEFIQNCDVNLEFIQDYDTGEDDFEYSESNEVFSVLFNLTTKRCRFIFDNYYPVPVRNKEVVVYVVTTGEIAEEAEANFVDDHGKDDYMSNYFRDYLEGIINLDYEFIQNRCLQGRKVYTI